MKLLLVSVVSVLCLTGCMSKIGITDISGKRDCKSGFPLTGKVTTEGTVEYGQTGGVSDQEAQDETPAL